MQTTGTSRRQKAKNQQSRFYPNISSSSASLHFFAASIRTAQRGNERRTAHQSCQGRVKVNVRCCNSSCEFMCMNKPSHEGGLVTGCSFWLCSVIVCTVGRYVPTRWVSGSNNGSGVFSCVSLFRLSALPSHMHAHPCCSHVTWCSPRNTVPVFFHGTCTAHSHTHQPVSWMRARTWQIGI